MKKKKNKKKLYLVQYFMYDKEEKSKISVEETMWKLLKKMRKNLRK